MDGVYRHYFSCPISDDDVEIFGIPRGTADGQQTWECLAILVAIDIWACHWKQDRIVLQVRGDNVGALALLIKMRPGSPKIAIIARELALRLVELSFPPDAVHTPGLAHKVADLLSRVHAPGAIGDSDTVVHPALAQAARTEVPVRSKAWYRAYIDEPDNAWQE